jgi:hypothetical protein
MKVLLVRGWAAWAAWAAALWIVLATGCGGVGIGGTGTGAAFPAFAASPAPVCGSDFADRLDCPTPSGVQGPAPAGTPVVRFVDATGTLVLEVDGNDVHLDASCLHLHFDGSYGTRSGAAPAFFGVSMVDSVESLAALAVQKADPSGLSIELRDADGQVVIGSTTLQRAAATLPMPQPCGG